MAVEWSHCKRTQFRAAHHHHCLTKYTQYQNQLKILQCPNKRGCIFLSDTTCSANQLTLYITSVFIELLEQRILLLAACIAYLRVMYILYQENTNIVILYRCKIMLALSQSKHFCDSTNHIHALIFHSCSTQHKKCLCSCT